MIKYCQLNTSVSKKKKNLIKSKLYSQSCFKTMYIETGLCRVYLQYFNVMELQGLNAPHY